MGWQDRAWAFLRAMGDSIPWIVLFVVGVGLQALPSTQKTPLPTDVQVVLVAVGAAASLLGSFGIGEQIGRARSNEALRVKLETAFRRTARLYDRLRVVQEDLKTAADHISDAVQSKDVVPVHVVAQGLETVHVRLEEQITTYDNALDEWHELVPREVEKERERLQAGRLQ